jgi:hypothetical protein
MPDWPMMGGQRYESGGHDTANSRGTTVTTGTANTKSASWVQIMASTGFDASGILIQLTDTAAGGDFLVDIAFGAAGSEVVKIANLCAASSTGSVTRGAVYLIPIHIPAGTRISAKSQSSLAAASTIRVILTLWSQGFAPSQQLSRVVTYGANTADSGGVSVDPGGTLNTKATTDPGSSGGFYTIGTTTAQHSYLILAFPNQVNTVRTSCSWLVDVTVGASGSRTTLIPNLQLQCSTTDDLVLPTVLGPFPVDIPEGTVLGVRAQANITDATDRLFDCIIYGIS